MRMEIPVALVRSVQLLTSNSLTEVSEKNKRKENDNKKRPEFTSVRKEGTLVYNSLAHSQFVNPILTHK